MSSRANAVAVAALVLGTLSSSAPAAAAAGSPFNGGRVDGQAPYGEVFVSREAVHIYLYDRKDDNYWVTVHYVTTLGNDVDLKAGPKESSAHDFVFFGSIDRLQFCWVRADGDKTYRTCHKTKTIEK
ncbi:hypothetical protein [Nonomuraea sp. B19D2]|uniref:hypothetical protein n=1 Tax=Nonomuraea sp. B19D2 TaxID=3159561 RepID=UPI0032DB112E